MSEETTVTTWSTSGTRFGPDENAPIGFIGSFSGYQPTTDQDCMIKLIDISHQTYGKYQYCTKYKDYWYADRDFDRYGIPKNGAIPSPFHHPNAKPFRKSFLSGIFS